MNFGEQLTTLRLKAGLTNRGLASKASVPHSLIAALQAGRRGIGEYQANKIGKALGLEGAELDSFVLSAINTCTEKVLNEAKDYPASFINMVARQLRQAGILPQHFMKFQMSGNGSKHVIKIYLHDGRIASLCSSLTLA